jgi:hypothetical protein
MELVVPTPEGLELRPQCLESPLAQIGADRLDEVEQAARNLLERVAMVAAHVDCYDLATEIHSRAGRPNARTVRIGVTWSRCVWESTPCPT